MCTEFILPQTTGYRISGRTMDFAATFTWQLAAIPLTTSLKAIDTLSPSAPAYQWQAKYGFMGIGIKLPLNILDTKLCDAMNTEGFSAAALWLPPSRYPKKADAPQNAKLISALDICGWAASNYSSVETLKNDLYAIQQGKPTSLGEVLYFWDPLQFSEQSELNKTDELKNLIPIHFQFHDKTGASLVLEFRDGQLSITDNTDIGVMTNTPFIEWHRTNLENYLGVTNVETASKTIIGMNVNRAGNGGGSIGLSSSALPSDRFLRTTMTLNYSIPWLNQAKRPSNTAAIAHAMNVIKGIYVTREQCIEQADNIKGDYTQWEIVRDHDNQVFYIATTASLGFWQVNFSDYQLGQNAQPQFAVISDATQMPVLTATT
ncbi:MULTISPECIES: linear amide C-N hydrolase [Acinetobacter]|uniref:Linear amide C-N hydrolase n=1 Tax=Acinetobacter corruptisaponis TaxID=3045147 RepID=A0ABY8S3N3_9GAMM|nr:linear amide C-N hydrolase [Acinetobacter sp. KCTC 92772]WHP06041.1 linear amide C-N hydrolase [Acinetobacter sp. KCTC 92772]